MYNSDNEIFHHSKFAWYAKRSSLADINPKSHYLTAFSLLNPLRYVYLHALNVEFFSKDLKSMLLLFRNIGNKALFTHDRIAFFVGSYL